MRRKGDVRSGFQPCETCGMGQGNACTCPPAHGCDENADVAARGSQTPAATVASSSDDESEFVPSSTLLDNGVLLIRENGPKVNVCASNAPQTPQKLKHNPKKMQKRKIGATQNTPDTKRNKGTPAPAWTVSGDGHQDSDSEDSEDHTTSTHVFGEGKNAGLEEDWVWKELDQDHFRLPSRKQLGVLDALAQEALTIAASNTAYLPAEAAAHLGHPLDEASPLHVIERPRRGRYYQDTWAEADFLDTLKTLSKDGDFDTSEFQVYTSNHDLVDQYDDDAFEDYVATLEMASSANSQVVVERIHTHPASAGVLAMSQETDPQTSHPASWGRKRRTSEPSDADEVSDALGMCIKALVPQTVSNCHALRQVFDRVAEETELEPIFEQERRLTTEIETYYQRWKQTKAGFRSASVLSAWRAALRSQNFNPMQLSAVEFAARFAMTLQRGDGIDFLDHTGQWEPAFVVDLFVATSKMSSHAKIQLVRHGAVSQEWCCVFSGRIMPPGTNTQRAASVLDIKIHPTPADDASMILQHSAEFHKEVASPPPSIDAPLSPPTSS